MGDVFNAMRGYGQEKRARNRESSPALLRGAGVHFIERNDGAHLIVDGPKGSIDFWPGT